MTTVYKIPRSVLVVIHTPDLQVLMLERAGWQGFWQSVTGSLAHESEPLRDAAIREVREETGLDAARYDLSDWGVENRFEIFKKHLSYKWLPWREAAALTLSWTNRDAILALPQRIGFTAP